MLNPEKIHRLDRIVFNTEQLIKINSWAKERDYASDRNEIRFPMHEGIMDSTHESGSLIYFKITDEIVDLAVINNDKMTFINWKTRMMTDANHDYNTKYKKDEILKFQITTFYYFLAVMFYITEFRENIDCVKKDLIKEKILKSSKNGKRTKRIINVGRYYLNTPTDIPVVKRIIQRHIHAWAVRGHWRNYKTGKRVWVNPHRKGKGETEMREYRV